MRRPQVITIAATALLILCGHPSFAADISSDYIWKPINIGAGGFADGILISQTDPNVRFVRTDTGQYYRWSVEDKAWLPMVVQHDDGSGFGKSIIPEPSHFICAKGNDGGSFALDPNDNKTIFLYCCLGGMWANADYYGGYPWNVYKSVDGGKNFAATHFNEAAKFSLKTNDTFLNSFRSDGECLSVDPNNSKVVYIGTGTRGVFKSTDRGDTWSAMTGDGLPEFIGKYAFNILPYKKGGTTIVNGVNVSKIIFLVVNTEPAFAGMINPSAAGVTGGVVAVLAVDDSKKTTLNLMATDVMADAVKKQIGNKVAVAGILKNNTLAVSGINATQPSTVYLSQDGGQTWINIGKDAGGPMNGNCHAGVLDQNTGVLYVPAAEISNGRVGRGAWKYANGVWTSKLVPYWNQLTFIAIDPLNSNNLFAMGTGPCISVDGGKTWTQNEWIKHMPTSNAQGYSGSPWAGGAMDCAATALIDTKGTVWLIGGNYGVITWKFDATAVKKSSDFIWTPNAAGVENFCPMDIVYPRNWGGKAVVSVMDDDFMVINNPDTFDVSPSTIETWLNNGQSISVCPNDPNTFAIVSYASRITTNGGKTVSIFKDAGTNAVPPPYSIPKGLGFGCMQISRRGDWKAGEDHLVWVVSKMVCYSKDGGKTWAKSTTDFGKCSVATSPWTVCHEVVADPFTPDKFYIYFSVGGFWTTTDGGVTWTHGTRSEGDLGSIEIRANEIVPNDLWLATPTHGICHSIDAGTTWNNVPGNGGQPFNGCHLALGKGRGQPGDAPYTIYTIYHDDTRQPAKDYGIYRSTNAGGSWDRIARWPTGLMCPSGLIGASWDTFGLVGVSISGQGFVYGKPKK